MSDEIPYWPSDNHPLFLRELPKHVRESSRHPDAAHHPDVAAVSVWCSCGLWRSTRPWDVQSHQAGFEEHLADVQRVVRVLPADLLKYGYARMRCLDEDAAVEVASAWIDRASARNRVFLDGDAVVVAFMDAQYLADIVHGALDRVDPTAVYLVNALKHMAAPPKPED
ncbi:hypothetical protein [Embleya sp. NBC_00896]|uniref:hypothetical protein n=1 Tax=Embleya sp. NBC_00896 TaxID=2975961 RepID=UPI002F91537E|nr:hypothetical protein OG928_42135 [Embleya sp. NBC_00896]